MSATKQIPKGIDAAPEERFKSQQTNEFQNQAQVNARTAANSVGVIKHDDVYKKPVDPDIVNKFWGIESKEMDELAQQKEFAKNKEAFYGVDPHAPPTIRRAPEETEEEAMRKFFAVEEKKELKLGAPIPGYGGCNRRVGADNVFGLTYAEARRRADESLHKINNEKGETLKMNSTFVPAHHRPKDEDEFF